MRIEPKAVGGSRSDEWSNLLGKQAIRALRANDAGPEERDRQSSAAIAALAGIAPPDEPEGMPSRSRPTTRQWRAAGAP
jgi:hypothetical protein